MICTVMFGNGVPIGLVAIMAALLLLTLKALTQTTAACCAAAAGIATLSTAVLRSGVTRVPTLRAAATLGSAWFLFLSSP